MATLDGYFEGKDHDLSWHNTDKEFTQFSVEQLDEVDTLIFGHKTYQLMADYWPSQQAKTEDSGVATRMNSLNKVVFSHDAFEAEWENTVVSTNPTEKISELKQQSVKDIMVLGSSHLGAEMLEAGLLDEVRVMINPVFIGEGSALFEGLNKDLKLISTRTFENGNVLLTYSAKA